MKTISFFRLLLCLLIPFAYTPLKACQLASACDTLYLADGSVHLIRVVGREWGDLRFTLCDEPGGKVRKVPRKAIRALRRSHESIVKKVKPAPDKALRKARMALFLSILAAAGALAIVPGLILGLVTLDVIDTAKELAIGRPNEARIRRLCTWALVLCIVALAFATGFLLLILYLLYGG